jgi:hypothetical protein
MSIASSRHPNNEMTLARAAVRALRMARAAALQAPVDLVEVRGDQLVRIREGVVVEVLEQLPPRRTVTAGTVARDFRSE